MATITLRNVPPELHRRLKERADRNRRSLNHEAIRCLETVVAEPSADSDRLHRLDGLSARLEKDGVWLTAEQIQTAKEQGRE